VAIYAGIDLGSRSVKLVLLNEKEELELHKFDTISFYRKYGKLTNGQLKVEFEKLGIKKEFDFLVSTGYGWQVINVQRVSGSKNIPEIKAHIYGAVFLTGLVDFTLLDLGGQDSKVAKVRNKRLIDFETNDRCAASTGRYLENMAVVLGISLEELSCYHENTVELSSTCAIFGETELIGKLVEGNSIAELAAGVNYTIFRRIKPLLLKLLSPVIVFTGGVAHNQAIKKIIERELNVKVVVPDNPQYAGAIGCAVSAKQEYLKDV